MTGHVVAAWVVLTAFNLTLWLWSLRNLSKTFALIERWEAGRG